jgi:hypothetical protein
VSNGAAAVPITGTDVFASSSEPLLLPAHVCFCFVFSIERKIVILNNNKTVGRPSQACKKKTSSELTGIVAIDGHSRALATQQVETGILDLAELR